MIRFLYILLLIALSSCSASWHIQRAKRKDPSMFGDTTRTIGKLNLKPANLPTPELDWCFNSEIKWVTPREVIYKGDTIRDSIRVWYRPALTHEDSVSIHSALEVDCDPIIIDNTVPPVVIKPSLWDKLEYVGYLILALVICLILYQVIKNLGIKGLKNE